MNGVAGNASGHLWQQPRLSFAYPGRQRSLPPLAPHSAAGDSLFPFGNHVLQIWIRVLV